MNKQSVWQTFGHNLIKKILDRHINAYDFAHAYLFLGAEGLGKKTIALEFAKKILDSENLFIHPDFLLIDEQTEITIDSVLKIIEFSGLSPFYGKKKVIIVNNADLLNIQASNAFLKTLEEPKNSNIFILISSRKLLPTITSRCQFFSFNRFSNAQLKDFSNKFFSKDFNQIWYEIVGGSLGKFVDLYKNPSLAKGYEDQYKNLKQYTESTFAEKVLFLNTLSENEPKEIKEFFLMYLNFLRNRLKFFPEYFSFMNLILETYKKINVEGRNKKIVLQELLIKI